VIPFLLTMIYFYPQAPPVTASMEGIVVLGTGSPVANAQVSIAGPQLAQTVADETGHFAIRDLQPGKYRVVAALRGYTIGQSRGTSIEVGPAQQIRGVVLALVPEGLISGHVSDSNGDPVANANVEALKYAYQDGRRILIRAIDGRTNSRGDYEFSLAPGPYVVRAQSMSDRESHLSVYFPGTTDASSASSVDVPAGLNFTGVDIRLVETRGLRIRGRIRNGLTGAAVAGAGITLLPHRGTVSTGSTQHVVSSGEGTFEFHQMAPGTYDIVSSVPNAGVKLAAAVPLEVGSTDIDDISIVVEPQLTIDGKIAIENQPAANRDLRGIRIELRREPFTPELLVLLPNVAPDGTFTLSDVTPGEYQLKVNAGRNAYVKMARFGAVDALNPPFHIGAGQAPLDIVISPNAGMVDALVVDDKLTAVRDAIVVLVPEAPQRNRPDLYKAQATDSAGRAHLADLAPGDYRLFAWDEIPADAWQDPDFIRPYEARGRLIHVYEGSADTVRVELIVQTRR
jgi:uncharacterized surface anchored protein